MKKLLALLLCAAMLIFSAVACAKTDNAGGRQLANRDNASADSTASLSSFVTSDPNAPHEVVSADSGSSAPRVSGMLSLPTGSDPSPGAPDPSSEVVSSDPAGELPTSSQTASNTTSRFEVPSTNTYASFTASAPDLYNNGYLKIDGRSEQMKTLFGKPKDSMTMDNTGTCFAMNLDCEGDVKMAYEVKLKVGRSDPEYLNAYVRVFVDGKDMGRVALKGMVATEYDDTVTIAQGLSKGKHEIRLYKSTEAQLSVVNIISFTMNGVPLSKPTDKKMYIEFMGDSYTAGYGNMLIDGKLPGSSETIAAANAPDYSDGTATFAFKTAQNLNADFSAVCASGHSFAFDFSGMSADDFFKKTCPLYRDGTKPYDFSKARQPDVVVVALGANDVMNADNYGVKESDFESRAEALVNTIKSVYPNTKVVFYFDSKDSKPLAEAARKGVEKAGGYFMVTTKLGYNGGGGHPNEKQHADMAKELTEFIQNNVLK